MSSSDSEDDIHQCGRCKQIFKSIDQYFVHKKEKSCQKLKSKKKERHLEEEKALLVEDEATNEGPSQTVFLASVHLEAANPGNTQHSEEGTIGTRLKKRHKSSQLKTTGEDDGGEDSRVGRRANAARPRRGGRGRGRGRGQSRKLGDSKDDHSESRPKIGQKTRSASLTARNVAAAKKRPCQKEVSSGHVELKGRAARGRAAARALVAAKLKEIEGDDGIDIDLGISHKYATILTAKQLAQRKEAVILRSNKFFQCPECSYRAKHQDEYDRHLRTVHNLSTYVCPSCLLPFRDKYKLKRHLDTKRCKGKSTNDEVPKYMKFTSSSRIFKKNLESNEQKDSDEEEDNEPKTKIPRGNFLYNYGVTHPFQCNECDRTFTSYDQIVSHLDQHPDIFPGICRFCGRWFPSRYKLWRHMTSSIHDDVEEPVMQQAKAEIQKLKINWPAESMKKSSSFTKYECKRCSITFSTKVTLLNHMKETHVPVTVNKRFRCDHCTSNFGKRAGLLKHLKEDHGINDPNSLSQFKCPVCDRIFKQKSHVLRHRESLHTPVQQVPWTDTDTDKCTDEAQAPDVNAETSAKSTSKETETQREDGENVQTDVDEGAESSESEKLEKPRCVHNCFVCYKGLEDKARLIEHLDMHRIWARKTDIAPSPLDIFENPPRVPNDRDKGSFMAFVPPWEKNSTNQNQTSVVSDLTGEAETIQSNGEEETLTSLTTIDQAAFSNLMKEQIMENSADTQTEAKDAKSETSTFIIIQPTPGETINPPEPPLGPEKNVEEKCKGENSENKERNTSEYLCPYCLTLKGTLEDMYNHKANDHNLRAVFRCVDSECSEIFTTVEAFMEHSKVHPQKSFICNICNDHFTDTSSLIGHKSAMHRNIHSAGGNVCKVCHKSFASKEALKAHSTKDLHHHQCHQCGTILKSPTDLREHQAAHKGVKSFLCEQCGATFASKLALKRHIVTHNPTKSHACDICDAAFNKKEHLRRHKVAKHSDDKPFVCKHSGCDKAFSRKDKLQEHMKAHSTEKPYICQQCGRRYRYREGLRYHERTHERSTKYTCSICSVPFPRPGQLRTHLKSVHGIATKEQHLYPCPQCSALFSRPERVKRHMEREHGVSALWKVYCKLCNRGFPGEKSLDSHMKTRHAPGPDGVPQKLKRVAKKPRKANISKEMAPSAEHDLLAAVMDQSLQSSVPVVPPGTSVPVPSSAQSTDTQFNSATIVVNIVHDNHSLRSTTGANQQTTPVAMMTHHHQPITILPPAPQVNEAPIEQPVITSAPVLTDTHTERVRPFDHEGGLDLLPQTVTPGQASSHITGSPIVTGERQVLQTLMPASFLPEKSPPSGIRTTDRISTVTSTLLPANGAFQPVSSDRTSIAPQVNSATILTTSEPTNQSVPASLAPASLAAASLAQARLTPVICGDRTTAGTMGHDPHAPIVVITSVNLSSTNTVQYVPATYSTYTNYDGRY